MADTHAPRPNATPEAGYAAEPTKAPGLPAGSVEARRAAFEAQKQYMDDRFGRNRAVGRKPFA